jgi:hypothetical protein
MPTPSPWASAQLDLLDAGWQRLQRVIERLCSGQQGPAGLDRPIGTGWTVKEMLAHLAFWDETSLPVIENIYRGKPEIPPAAWYGGDDLELAPNDPWPDPDTHNAREARWARNHTTAEVLARLQRAREQLKTILATVTDEEGHGPLGQQWSAAEVNRHVDGHLAKL